MDISPGLIAGRLEGISIPDLIWSLCRLQVTGTLTLNRASIGKTVYLQNGRIVFAASDDPDDRLGELLFREGLITLEQLEEAIDQLGCGKRLGTILVEAGYLSPENLVRGVLLQVKTIVLDLFGWDHAEYRFDEGPLPTQEVITLGMKTGELLLQGIRGIRSFTRIRRSVGAPRTRYSLTESWREYLDGLNLTEAEEMILSRLEGDGASIEELCRDLYLSNFEIYQALWAFRILGAIREDEQIAYAATEATLEGLFGSEGIAPLLVRLGRSVETGVLYINRGTLERTFHLKEGRCVFATSNDIDDGLVSYLLRRGVISLKDREETAKRLLSNKRVGTILQELGVLNQEDLRNMVREHLLEIIYDSLAWEYGEYVFVAGELPTIEEITLESSVEDLVAEGLLRVSSWSRVKDGCGGIDCSLTLTPMFLEVLDHMSIGPEEWEVVTSLKEPKTVRQLCEASELEDFRICQLLWTFRLLGAIELAPVSEEVVEQPEAGSALLAAAAAQRTEEPAEEPEVEQAYEPEHAPETGLEVVEESDPAAVEAEVEPAVLLTEPVEDAGEEPEEEPEEEPIVILAEREDEPEDEPEFTLADPEPEPAGEPEEEPEFSLADVLTDEPEEPTVEPEPVEETVEEPEIEPEFSLAETDEEPAAEAGEERDVLEIPVETEESGPSWELEEEPEAVEPAEEPEEVPEFAAAGPVEEPDPSADDTVRLSREQVEAALAGGDVEPEIEAEVPPLDSPADATMYISREEVEIALESAPEEIDPSSIEEPGEVEDTAKIDRQEIEATMEEEGPEEIEEELDPFEPPPDLEDQISRFNMRQRVVFRTIRAEVGAGAVNFVRSCCGRIGTGGESWLEQVPLRPDGTWDSEGLRQAVLDHRVDDPGADYSRLLEIELDMLHLHIGDARAQSLREQMESVEPLEGR